MEYVLKTSAVIAIFYMCYKLFLQRETFFEQNRWFLLLGLLTSFLLPFLVIPVYIEITPVDLSGFVISTASPAVIEEKSFNILDYLPLIYGLGVVFFSFRFLVQFISLGLIIFRNTITKSGGFKLVKTNNDISPFSFFNWIIYNPKHFSETELTQIITHEKVHANQKHSMDILITHLSCIVLWFNPFIWLYTKILKQNLEFIADKEATKRTACKKSYQYTLLKTSMPSHQMALSNNFYNSLIKKRIVMLHKSKSKKINLLKYALIAPILGLFLMSFNTEEVYVSQKSVSETVSTKDLLEVLITKDFTDKDIEEIKTTLKVEGYIAKFKGIKRNSKNEITAIKIEVNSKSAHANYSINTDHPISPIKLIIKNGDISISNGNASNEDHLVMISDDEDENEEIESNTEKKIIIISSKNKDIIGEKEEIIIKNDDTLNIPQTKNKSKVKIISSNNERPLYLLDGKEISSVDMENLSPNEIKSINVLKDKKATEAYGNKGKNGVVEISTKSPEWKTKVIIHKDFDSIKGKLQNSFTIPKNALYIVDGKETNITGIKKDSELEKSIMTIFILKGEKATEKYGDKGKNGAVEVTTKKKE